MTIPNEKTLDDVIREIDTSDELDISKHLDHEYPTEDSEDEYEPEDDDYNHRELDFDY